MVAARKAPVYTTSPFEAALEERRDLSVNMHGALGSRTDSPLDICTRGGSHTAAVHLLEACVEINVIRGWLGHVSLETTNRYAEIANVRAAPMNEAHAKTQPVHPTSRWASRRKTFAP